MEKRYIFAICAVILVAAAAAVYFFCFATPPVPRETYDRMKETLPLSTYDDKLLNPDDKFEFSTEKPSYRIKDHTEIGIVMTDNGFSHAETPRFTTVEIKIDGQWYTIIQGGAAPDFGPYWYIFDNVKTISNTIHLYKIGQKIPERIVRTEDDIIVTTAYEFDWVPGEYRFVTWIRAGRFIPNNSYAAEFRLK